MKRICHIFDRPFEQENTAGFQRSNDLDSFVRGKAVGGDAEAEAAYEVCVDLFRSDNPRFDVGRFRAACGLEAKP